MFKPNLFRIEPKGPVWAYKSYEIKAPLRTHWRKATCAEIECAAFREGWITTVPVDHPATEYIRSGMSGRHYTEKPAVQYDEETGTDILLVGMTSFHFPPGQQGFAGPEHDGHRIPLERDPIFISRDGDYRGNPTGRRRTNMRPEDWVDDFANHQIRLVEQKERG